MLDLLWDIFQQAEINDLNAARLRQLQRSAAQDKKSDTIENRLLKLEQRHEQLKLVTLALWSLLRDQSGLQDAALREYIEKIDMLDGKKDGKVSMQPEKVECAHCNHNVLATSSVCAYCGAALNRSKNNHLFPDA